MSNIVSFTEMDQMAGAIAASGLFGMKDKNSVLALMAVAQAEGLHPASAARDFHIIQGRPALKADAMLARFQNAGGMVDWKEYTDERVTGVFKHPNGGSLEVTWTIDQARSIGLVKPGSGWQKFPRAMLRSRCISEGIRSVFPGSVTGYYTPEEVSDFEPPKEMGKVEVVAPTIETIEEDVPEVVKPAGNFAKFVAKHDLFIPGNDEPYAQYLSVEDWQDGFIDLVTRIYESGKFDSKQKMEKHNALRDANATFMKSWSGKQTAKMLEKISTLRSQYDHATS
jgi:RecT family